MWAVTPPPFEPAWARLVTAWLAAGEAGDAGTALLQRALDHGVHALELPAAGEVTVGQGPERRSVGGPGTLQLAADGVERLSLEGGQHR